MNANSVLAVALLAGTIIGAGIFSLPYLISRTGLVSGFFYFLFFGCVYYVVHRMYADVLVVTGSKHQFLFVMQRFLPRFAARILGSAVFLELILVLVVYLILAPSFLSLIAGGSGSIIPVILFWVVSSLFLFARLSWIGWAEFSGVVAIVAIVAALLWKGWGAGITTPAFSPFSLAGFLLPIGPLLFSLSGRPAIGKVVEEWEKAKTGWRPFSLGSSIAWGTLIPVGLYMLFVLGILSITPHPSADSLSAFVGLSPVLSTLVGALGFLTLWTSYGMIAVNIKDTLHDDLRTGRWIAFAVPVCVPISLYFLGVNHFFGVIAFVGSVFLGLEGIAITWIWLKAFPMHPRRWVVFPIFTVFLVALVSEVIKYF